MNAHAKQFTKSFKQMGETLELDESFEMANTPSGFRGITLRPHQATIVAALLDIVRERRIEVDSMSKRWAPEMRYSGGPIQITTDAALLSESFGSGKTIEILALIMLQPIPRALPSIAAERYNLLNSKFVAAEITCKYIGPRALLRPALIIVGNSVLLQWQQEITSRTTLRVFTISNYYSLVKFYEIYQAGLCSVYDIILLKNGNITGAIQLAGEVTLAEIRNSVEVIRKMTSNNCWSYVVYDDYDTIKIPQELRGVPALFTIYVSATKHDSQITHRTYFTPCNSNVLSVLRDLNRPRIVEVVKHSGSLMHEFNVRNKVEYVEQSCRMTKMNIYSYSCKNPDDNYIRMLGAIGDYDTNLIMEMMNGNAMRTAAETLGIKSTTAADIFQKMLDNKYDAYMRDTRILSIVETVRKEIETLPKNTDDFYAISLEGFRDAIVRGIKPGFQVNSPAVQNLLNSLYTEYTKSREANGIAIRRVIDNVREGMCQICYVPFEENNNAFIMRCCGVIICDACVIRGCRIENKFSREINANALEGRCSHCRRTVLFHRDLIYVDRDFNIESLLKARGDECGDEHSADVALVDEEEIKNPKLHILYEIICGRAAKQSRSVVSRKIANLVEGQVDIPCAANTPFNSDGMQRKVIVFASFNETLGLIETFLESRKVDYLRLGGTAAQKAETIDAFRHKCTVLLINSSQQCAGMNLEFATDLVFFHVINDPNIEAQAAGRLQRIGRTQNAQIHYLAYHNEAKKIGT